MPVIMGLQAEVSLRWQQTEACPWLRQGVACRAKQRCTMANKKGLGPSQTLLTCQVRNSPGMAQNSQLAILMTVFTLLSLKWVPGSPGGDK